ncbi:hypothetical protein [Naasia sp. SYSU D00057]|uniref:hypothetical protein n=1 Tax=Naasia sp. SYSU D00057 TaxID=2817380 RepID=UPI001B316718|nr:hypothetical protein [Naasia sp. SYSU D00057]
MTLRSAAAALAAGATIIALAACTGPSGSAAPAPTVLPVAENPITNDSTEPGLEVVLAAVEDNEDPETGQPISDRLQLILRNTTDRTLEDLEVFYVMTDVETGESEGYHQDLGDLTIPAGAETAVYFDNESGEGHYPENQFSLYRSSANQVDFEIEVSASGVQVAHATASKEAGTGEEAD